MFPSLSLKSSAEVKGESIHVRPTFSLKKCEPTYQMFLHLPYGAESLNADSATLSFSFLLMDKAEIYLSCKVSRVDFKSVSKSSLGHGKWVLNSTEMTDSKFTEEDIKSFHFL
jgi:hypothetical protein